MCRSSKNHKVELFWNFFGPIPFAPEWETGSESSERNQAASRLRGFRRKQEAAENSMQLIYDQQVRAWSEVPPKLSERRGSSGTDLRTAQLPLVELG